MAVSIEPPWREVCPALAGIVATATDGKGWTRKYAGMIPRAQKQPKMASFALQNVLH